MFEQTEIQFHTAGNHLLYQEPDIHKRIGILKLCANKNIAEEFDVKKIYMLFTIDCSSSMSLKYKNRNTKIQQVIHTLKGIFKELAKESEKNNTEIHVAVTGFGQILYQILDFIKITPENVSSLLAILDNIKTYTLTNIEIALQNAKNILDGLSSDNTRIYHVFMTDGEITMGENNPHKLRQMVDTNYTTICIGFGKEHDCGLLIELSNFLRGEYYFIDNTENSAMVYGEIVYNIIYHAIDAFKLRLYNGLIYDWKNNQWVSELEIASLSNDREKIFHLVTYGNIHDIEIEIVMSYGHLTTKDEVRSCLYGEEVIETLYCYPPLIDIRDSMSPVTVTGLEEEDGGCTPELFGPIDIPLESYGPNSSGVRLGPNSSGVRLGPLLDVEPINLSKYHFRQKTQELMYETRIFLDTHKNDKLPPPTLQRQKSGYYRPSPNLTRKVASLLRSEEEFDDFSYNKDQNQKLDDSPLEHFSVEDENDETKCINMVREQSSQQLTSEMTKGHRRSLENIRNKAAIQEHKNKLGCFLKDMFDFMKANHLTEDDFMKRLGNDIYVLYHTLGNQDAEMWCVSREVSQGRQQSYMPSMFDDHHDDDIKCLTREINTPCVDFSKIEDVENTLDFWDNEYKSGPTNMDFTTTNQTMMDMISSIQDNV